MANQTPLLPQVEMVTHLTKAGLGSLELFSMGLKSTGTYLSRALSYKGAEFSIAKVDIDPQFQCVPAGPLVSLA
jgi:P-loop containing NTP hydrolase pore-1